MVFGSVTRRARGGPTAGWSALQRRMHVHERHAFGSHPGEIRRGSRRTRGDGAKSGTHGARRAPQPSGVHLQSGAAAGIACGARERILRPVEVRFAAVVRRAGRRSARSRDDRRADPVDAVDRRRSRAARVLRGQPPDPSHLCPARHPVRQRPPRQLPQRGGRCRAGDGGIHPRRRRRRGSGAVR